MMPYDLALQKLALVVDLSVLARPSCDKLLNSFIDNKWSLLLNGKIFEVDFNKRLDYQHLLTDSPTLLNTVKWLILLSIVDSRATNSPLDCEGSINKYLNHVLYFIRYLRWKIGLRNPNNATSKIIRDFAGNLHKTVGYNLDYLRRINTHKTGFKHYVKKVEGKNTKNRSSFDINSLMFDLGIPTNSWSSYKELADISYDLREQYEIKKGVTIKNSGKKKSLYQINSSWTIEKYISSLNRTLSIATYFPSLVSMMPTGIAPISSSELKVIVQKAKPYGKTKDVPFFVMKKAIERSIEFILHYGLPLLKHRNKSLEQFTCLANSKPKYNLADLSKEYFRKYPIIIDGYKEIFPTISLTNFDKCQGRTSSLDMKSNWAMATELYTNGLTLVEIAKKYSTTKSTIFLWIKKYNDPFREQSQNYSLTSFLCRHMMVAINLVLCFFTARRSVEIQSLKAGCITSTASGHWIEMYVAKTYKINDQFPATNLMKICIELLEDISLPARKISGDSCLWQYKNLLNDDVSKFYFKSCRSAYFKFIDIKDEYSWTFSQHQFRRFFSGMFVNYFGGRVDTLQYYLRHENIAMTYDYLNSISEDYGQESSMRIAMIDVLEEHYLQSGSFNSSSEIGMKFNQCANKLKAVSENRIRLAYEKFIFDEDIIFEMIEGGLCVGNTKSFKRKSKCIDDAERIHTYSACYQQCNLCPNKLTLENWFYTSMEKQCLFYPVDSIIFKAVCS